MENYTAITVAAWIFYGVWGFEFASYYAFGFNPMHITLKIVPKFYNMARKKKKIIQPDLKKLRFLTVEPRKTRTSIPSKQKEIIIYNDETQ